MKTKNLTPMPLGTRVTARKPRRPEISIIVRGKFRVVHGGVLALVEDPNDPLAQGFMTADVFPEDDDDRAGEPVYPGDFAEFKPHAEAMLKGSCYTPRGEAMTECPVRMAVGGWSKSLKIVGRRVFSDAVSGAVASAPQPFTSMPIRWSTAYGGPDFEANPVGKGIAGAELPNVEPLGLSLRTRGDRMNAVSFAPINSMWPFRAKKVGKNYGAEWRKTRSPFYSDDYDWTHHQSASEDQWFPYLKGDEELQFQNLDPKIQLVKTRLPSLRVRAFLNDDKARAREVKLVLDTVFADLDEGFVYLTWRGLEEVREDDLADVATILIASEPLNASRPLADYLEMLAQFEADPTGFAEAKAKATPDVSKELARVDQLKNFQAEMQKAANDDDPKLVEKLVAGPGGRSDNEEEKKAADDLAKIIEASKKKNPEAPDANPSASLAASMRKAQSSDNADDMKKSFGAVKAQLPDAELKMRAAGVPEESIAEMKSAFEHPALAQFGLGKDEPKIGPGVDLSGLDLQDKDLRGVDLSAAILVGTNLCRANLSGARLVGANLERALLMDADLTGADFSGASLKLSLISGARAPGAIFKGAKFDRTVADRAKLVGAIFDEVDCTLSTFAEVDGTELHAVGAKFSICVWSDATLEGANFERATLERVMVRATKTTNASFARATLKTAGFDACDLTGTSFAESKGEVAVFTQSTMPDANFKHADLFRSHFTQSKMERANFISADLRGSRFYRTNLTRANFEFANLIRADFSKANLERAKFKNANLYAAAFIQSFGSGADFTEANLKRAMLERA